MDKVIKQDILNILEEVVDISEIVIEMDSILGEDIPIDSTEMLRILSRVESRYQFRFETKEVLGLKTFGNLLETVQRRSNMKE